MQNDFNELTHRPRALAVLIHLKCEELSKSNDKEALARLIENWRRLSLNLLRTSRNWHELEGRVYFVSFIENLADCARDIGMTGEEKELRDLMAKIGRETSSPPASFRMGSELALKSKADPKRLDSVARGETRRYPLPDDPSGFEAGRFAEYTAAERGFAMVAALLVLLPLSLAWLESFRRGKRVNGLADGLGPLLSWKDRAWILGLGCIAPLLWYWLVTRLTPPGCRDIGMSYHHFIPPLAIQMTAGLLLAGVLTLQSVQSRLKHRLGFLGLGARWPAAGWIVATITALVIPAAGCMRWLTGNHEAFSLGIAAACGIPLLWLVWQAGATAFTPQSGALGGAMLARFMATPLAATCLILSGSVPLLESIEREWMSKNTVSRVDLPKGGITTGEARTVDDLAKRITAILETEGRPAR